MKRIVLIALLIMLSVCVKAQVEIGGLNYQLDSDAKTATLTGYTTIEDGIETIPQEVSYESETYKVTSIGSSAFKGCSNLTSVTIPDGVTSIGYCAFEGCSGLTSI